MNFIGPRSTSEFLRICSESILNIAARMDNGDDASTLGGTALALRVRADLLEREEQTA